MHKPELLNSDRLSIQIPEDVVYLRSPINPVEYWREYSEFQQTKGNSVIDDTKPWLMINWPYIHQEPTVTSILKDRGIQVTSRFDIGRYTNLGREIYDFNTNNIEDFDSWGWYAVSRAIPGKLGERATILVVDQAFLSEDRYEEMVEAKKDIRRSLGETAFCMTWEDESYSTSFRCCHAPDFENIGKEWSVLNNYRCVDLSILNRSNIDIDPTILELLRDADPTSVERLYKNPKININYDNNLPTLFLINGPSGAGKDTLINELVDASYLDKIKSATTRSCRIDESNRDDSYTWMRKKYPEETIDQYQESLNEEYGLIELGYHNGNFYGLPMENIEKCLQEYSKPLVLVTDNEGVLKIYDVFQQRCNLISVFITPTDTKTLRDRISDRDNIEERMSDAIDLIKNAPLTSNFFLINDNNWLEYRKAVLALKTLVTQGIVK